ncbi:hypothetical protein NDR87_36940 [Nocardia sp. CDC159]|uniref:General stress protein 17M-like domain-containing protein n=1 Tax=Nocardia pulmonis TaxID=2951408 RepID=A0A9X2EEX4_9NOCA|nr:MULTISPECIES: general stress protein [Nocardia]MCM6779075.1 hypothetical protein [Nocardia pulmonis]MCM6791965.1 hypothetical protein [Nocardia sp. CDC159]
MAEFDTYAAAEEAVNKLSEKDFPVERATICGAGLRLVEHVLGRSTYPGAAVRGAAAGAWIGLVFGVFLALFTTSAVWWVATVGWAVLWGVVAGVVFGLVWRALPGERREFLSASELLADHYEVLVEPQFAEHARTLLNDLPTAPTSRSQ